MKKLRSLSIAIAVLLPLAGSAGKPKSETNAKPTAGAKTTAGGTRLLPFQVSADLPSGAALEKVDERVVVNAEAIGGLGMWVTVVDAVGTLEERKQLAGMSSPENLKTEALADGLLLTYETTNADDRFFVVEVVRTIRGKVYECHTTARTADAQAAVVKVCKSLR